jgi:CSLREA domain-containing protein
MTAARSMGRAILSILIGVSLLPVWANSAAADDTFLVTTTDDPGDGNCATNGCTLREAITAANSDITPDTDIINFSLPGSGPYVISPTSALPTITQPISLDGTSEPEYDGDPLVVIDGDSAGDVNGLTVASSANSIKGLVISGFDSTTTGGKAGILIQSGTGNTITDNYIGTNPAGTAADGNFFGIDVMTSNNVIGITQEFGNLIAGNSTDIRILGDSADGNDISGNVIGTSKADNAVLTPNTGILVNGADDTDIGIADTNYGNTINAGAGGIEIVNDSDTNEVYGNFVGTNSTGTADPAANSPVGISISNNSNGNTVGGDTPEERNLVSGNRVGIELGASFNDGGVNNDVLGNFVGTDITGTNPLPNSEHGIIAFNPDNEIGNTTGGGNLIAFNTLKGVVVSSARPANTGNRISGNSIHSNGELGIDLDPNGVTPNDNDDSDTGPNNIQNFPIVDMVTPTQGGVRLEGTFNSNPGEDYTLEFFSSPAKDGSNFGEGKTYLGSLGDSTDGDGDLAFDLTLTEVVPPGHFVTATATGPSGTSEFSQAVRMCTKIGTGGANTLEGTPGRDVLCGVGGNDTLRGLGSADALLGGGGNDKELGGGGPDLIFANKGADTLTGGRGPDEMKGAKGADTASFADSDNSVVVDLEDGTTTGWGADSLDKIESVRGSRKGDTLRGSAGSNVLLGKDGPDALKGRQGNDKLLGGDGNDGMNGGPGTDTCKQGSGSGPRRSCEKP